MGATLGRPAVIRRILVMELVFGAFFLADCVEVRVSGVVGWFDHPS